MIPTWSPAGISVQGKSVSLSGVQAAIDTGTTLIGGPEADVEAIYANIPGSRRMTGVYAGYFEYPCATQVSMTMSFGSFEVTIRVNDFNIGSYSDDASYCTGGVFVQGLASSSPVQWGKSSGVLSCRRLLLIVAWYRSLSRRRHHAQERLQRLPYE